MFVLPISGVPVRFRTAEGHDELLLAEGAGHPVHLRAETARRLTPPVDGALDWNRLPYADVDAALLALRRHITGDRLVAEVRCSACAAWCDTELSISAYLSAHRPRAAKDIEPQPDGWFCWRDLRFRIPDVGAVLDAVAAPADPLAALSRAAVGADSPEVAARVASILEKMAPPLSGLVRGRCPHCEQSVRGWFDPGAFVLTELQTRASVVFEHIHLLAQAYGWSEDAILALPAARRALYAARVEKEQGQ